MAWSLVYHRTAVTSLYAIPRGEVFYITEAIGGLQRNPYRPDAEQIAQDTYRIIVRGHTIEYVVSSREVKVLIIQ